MTILKKICPNCKEELKNLSIRETTKNPTSKTLKSFICFSCGFIYSIKRVEKYEYKQIGNLDLSEVKK